MDLNRLPPHKLKTYAINAPRSTHFRPGTCAEIDCPAYLNGWSTTVDERTELGMGQAHYIRKQSGRRFTETRTETGLTVFAFEAGQRCFKSSDHQTRIERPEIYVVRDGQRREARRHTSAASWQDDFANHQQTLADKQREG